MKEDNISQLGDHGAPFCELQYTHGSCYISLFKFKSFDQFNTPQTASNFRHLLSCGTIVSYQNKKCNIFNTRRRLSLKNNQVKKNVKKNRPTRLISPHQRVILGPG